MKIRLEDKYVCIVVDTDINENDFNGFDSEDVAEIVVGKAVQE